MDNEQLTALRLLLDQVAAGVALIEEVMDDEPAGWQGPARRGGERPALGNAHGLLSVAWVNIANDLVRRRGVASWEIAPLQTLGTDGPTTFEIAPEGGLAVEPSDLPRFDRHSVPNGVVRPVEHPTEPRYTLDEARALLEVCGSHQWQVETDAHNRPSRVVCSNCQEHWPLR